MLAIFLLLCHVQFLDISSRTLSAVKRKVEPSQKKKQGKPVNYLFKFGVSVDY